jgi:hypothetical protein
MGWSKKYKRSIDCNNPKGFSQKAHCAGRKKRESKMSLKLEELVGKKLTEEQFDEAAGKKDACYYKVKARYDVWPSAYASGALVKCRKVGAKNWGNKSKKESVNEAGMELNKLKDAIKMFQKKIEKQGRVTNARDEEHLSNLIKLYKQMGGKGVKEGLDDLKALPKDLKKSIKKNREEGFASDAQRRAAFASGYKEKGKKKKKKEGVNEITYKFKGYTASKMDELDAMLSRAGIQGTPDFNKMTYTVNYQKNPYSVNLDKIMKKKGGKKIKPIRLRGKSGMGKISHLGMESVDEVKYKGYDYKRQNRKDGLSLIVPALRKTFSNMKDLKKYIDKHGTMESVDEARGTCWVGYQQLGMKRKGGKMVPNCVKEITELYYEIDGEGYGYTFEYINDGKLNEAEYQGRKVKLGKIMQGDVKKFKVYVKNPKGNVVKVNFGQGGKSASKTGGTMRIRKSNPKARANFRARHNCDNPGPRHKARYWACRTW